MGFLQLNVYGDKNLLPSDIALGVPNATITPHTLHYPSSEGSPVIVDIHGTIENIRAITVGGIEYGIEGIQKTHFPENTWALHLKH